ncbi:coiled-coil domain-containing protein [Paenibacillus tarimensis]
MVHSFRILSFRTVVAFVLVLCIASPSSMAEPTEEETLKLLEKSLSVTEIDNEISRLAGVQQSMQGTISKLENELRLKEREVIRQQQNVDDVLRAYYTGERDILLRALFSFNSLSDLLAMLDYFDAIFARDKNILNSYKTQYRELKQGKDAVVLEKERLADMERKLMLQRNRLIALQQDIDNELNKRGDSERIRIMIKELTNFWQTVGLYEVKQYFAALADAMKELPDWLNENKQYLQFKGFEYTLRVPEDALNGFLRSQNELFEHFAFRFEQDKLKVQGKRDGLDVEISGRYTIEEEPVNSIRFHVDELKFNKLALPDTTRRALEEEFDLSFYPHLVVSFVKAKSVEILDGELVVILKLEL